MPRVNASLQVGRPGAPLGRAWRALAIPLLILILSIGASGTVPAAAQGQVRFESQEVSLDFPNQITYEARAISSGSPIVRAELVTYSPALLGSVSRSRHAVEVASGDDVDLHYVQDFSGTSVVPNMPITYQWRVWTEDGAEVTGSERSFAFEDTRYPWEVQQSDQVSVWTHDRSGDLGQRTFDLATQAIGAQRSLFGVQLQRQIQVIIYNNFDEFAAWHSTVGDFIGGEAYPEYAITTQIVPLLGPQGGWLENVIPHEISHLYFAQAAENPTVSIPTWLNEGVASYNEFGDPSAALQRVESAAAAGELIPLSSLKSGFGSHNEARARLAYDEALSAVTYIVKQHGLHSLTDLLHAYHSGMSTEPAFEHALNVDVGTFEASWAAWAGAAPGSYATVTPWPFPTFPPSPTPAVVGAQSGPSPTNPPEPSASAHPQPTPSPSPAPQSTGSLARPVGVGLILAAGLLIWLIGRRAAAQR